MSYKVVAIKGTFMMSPIKEQIIEANQTFGWSPAQTVADFANDVSEYYCLVDKEKLLGFVSLHHILSEVSINTVYIEPSKCRQGLATALLDYVLVQLKARNVQSLFLEVRTSNQGAIRLYQNAGFETIATRKNYYQHPIEDALILQLSLVKE